MEQYYLALIRGQKRGLLPALLRVLLAGAGMLYGLGVRLRNRFYDLGWKHTHRATVPVISIGNLTLGGTGKTPCVEYVARRLRGLDLQVAILSRGYAASHGPNDEALLLEQNLPDVPHLQGAERVALARTAVEELESEVLLLDDGFQHRRLHRDLDIVLIDATCPWGGGRVFPGGLLREPRAGLRRAHAVIITRCDQVEPAVIEQLRSEIGRLAPRACIAQTRHLPVALINSTGVSFSVLSGPNECLPRGRALAFCGIGNPDGFQRTLRDLGVEVVGFRAFPDHHNYSRADVEELHAWARRHECQAVVTTQKDLVKLQVDRLGQCALWALRIQLHVDAGADQLEEKLRDSVRNACPASSVDRVRTPRPTAALLTID